MTRIQGGVCFRGDNKTRHVVRCRRGFDLKKINLVILGLMIISAAACLVVNNQVSISGFALKDLQNQANQLSSANSDLQVQLTSLDAYNNLNARVQKLGLVADGTVQYLSVGTEAVAKQ